MLLQIDTMRHFYIKLILIIFLALEISSCVQNQEQPEKGNIPIFTNDSADIVRSGSWEQVYKDNIPGYILKNIHILKSGILVATGDHGVYRSLDRGNNWQKVFEIDLKASHFTNDSVGFASKGREIYKTKDRGANWDFLCEVSAPGVPGIDIANFDFASENEGVVAANIVFNDTGVTLGYILKTNDGGSTWFSVYKSDKYLENIILNSTGLGIAFRKGDTFYPSVVRTTDFGDSWELVQIGPQIYLNGVFQIGPDTIFASGGRVILRSQDAGLNWFQPDYKDDFHEAFHGMAFLTSKTGYISANRGGIYKTIDAGKRWYRQETNTSLDLYDVAFSDSVTGYAVGESCIILRYVPKND